MARGKKVSSAQVDPAPNVAAPLAAPKKRRAKIDFGKPYGTVHGLGEAKFEQENKLFGADGFELGDGPVESDQESEQPEEPAADTVVDEAALADMAAQ